MSTSTKSTSNKSYIYPNMVVVHIPRFFHVTYSDPDKVYPGFHTHCTPSLSLYPDLCLLIISPKSTRAKSSQAAPAEDVHRFLVLDCTLSFSSYPDLSLLAISAKSTMGRGSHVIPAETMHKFLLIDRHRTVLQPQIMALHRS